MLMNGSSSAPVLPLVAPQTAASLLEGSNIEWRGWAHVAVNCGRRMDYEAAPRAGSIAAAWPTRVRTWLPYRRLHATRRRMVAAILGIIGVAQPMCR